MDKVELDFMVVPEQLRECATVPDAVHIRVIDQIRMSALGILGESGKRLAASGVEFYFTRALAEKLIQQKIVEVVS